jgi:hypothetical protein
MPLSLMNLLRRVEETGGIGAGLKKDTRNRVTQMRRGHGWRKGTAFCTGVKDKNGQTEIDNVLVCNFLRIVIACISALVYLKRRPDTTTAVNGPNQPHSRAKTSGPMPPYQPISRVS